MWTWQRDFPTFSFLFESTQSKLVLSLCIQQDGRYSFLWSLFIIVLFGVSIFMHLNINSLLFTYCGAIYSSTQPSDSACLTSWNTYEPLNFSSFSFSHDNSSNIYSVYGGSSVCSLCGIVMAAQLLGKEALRLWIPEIHELTPHNSDDRKTFVRFYFFIYILKFLIYFL